MALGVQWALTEAAVAVLVELRATQPVELLVLVVVDMAVAQEENKVHAVQSVLFGPVVRVHSRQLV